MKMITYLLLIFIIVFAILILMTIPTTNCEDFAHEGNGGGGDSHGGSSHGGGNEIGGMGGMSNGNMGNGNRGGDFAGSSTQTDTLENAINNNSTLQNQGSGKLNNILNNQPNQNTMSVAQMNNTINQLNQNSTQQTQMNDNANQQKNQRMLQESRQERKQELSQEMPTMEETTKIRLQTPVRLEMQLPYVQSPSEQPQYSNNAIQTRTENNGNIFKAGIISNNTIINGDTNSKIKHIIKKSAELSFLALENNKEPVSALKSSNYAIAYVSALQEIYTEEQIQNATNINLNQFKNELLKIQNTIITNIKNTCSPLELDKQYLLKIIRNI